jgi:hypothetical protein
MRDAIDDIDAVWGAWSNGLEEDYAIANAVTMQ